MNARILALSMLFFISICIARPCCPEDPEHMTFDFVRTNSSYLIGNHLGETLPIPLNWWFKSCKANLYSMDGDFVISAKTSAGKLKEYSLTEYKNPRVRMYVTEDAIDRIWHADDMTLQATTEFFSGNISLIWRPFDGFFWPPDED